MGPSGSGKSTLLVHPGRAGAAHVGHGHARRPRSLRAGGDGAGRLPQPRGRLRLPGPLPAAAVLGARERAGARRWWRRRRRHEPTRARALLAQVGLGERLDHRPGGAVRRREAARGAGARAGPAAAAAALRRAHRQPRRAPPPATVADLLLELHAQAEDDPGRGHPQRRAGRALPRPPAPGAAGALAAAPDARRALVARSLRHYARTNAAVVARRGHRGGGARRARWSSATRCAPACAGWRWRGSGAPTCAVTSARFFREDLRDRAPPASARPCCAALRGTRRRGTRRAARRAGDVLGLRRRRALLGVPRRAAPAALEGRQAALLERGAAPRAAAPRPATRCWCARARPPTSRAARSSAAATSRARTLRVDRGAAAGRARRSASSRCSRGSSDGARGLRAAAPAAARAGPGRAREHVLLAAGRTRPSLAALVAARGTARRPGPAPARRSRRGALALESASGLARRRDGGRAARRGADALGLRSAAGRSSTSPTRSAPATAACRTRWWRRSTPTTLRPLGVGRELRDARHRAQRLGGARPRRAARATRVTLDYYVWQEEGRLETRTADFRAGRGRADGRRGRRPRPRARLPGHHRVAAPLRLGPAVPGRPLAHPAAGRGVLGPLPHDAEGLRARSRRASSSGDTAWAGSPRSASFRRPRRRGGWPRRASSARSLDALLPGAEPEPRRAPAARASRRCASARCAAAQRHAPTSASTSCTSASSWSWRRCCWPASSSAWASSSASREVGLLRALGLHRRAPAARSSWPRARCWPLVGASWARSRPRSTPRLVLLGLRTVWVGRRRHPRPAACAVHAGSRCCSARSAAVARGAARGAPGPCATCAAARRARCSRARWPTGRRRGRGRRLLSARAGAGRRGRRARGRRRRLRSPPARPRSSARARCCSPPPCAASRAGSRRPHARRPRRCGGRGLGLRGASYRPGRSLLLHRPHRRRPPS